MIAFTADNHIGITSQWSIKERGDDFMRAFERTIDAVIADKDPDKTLIVGGDLFDTAHPPSFAVEFVQRQVSRLKAAAPNGCSVVGIDGNHDVADEKWLRVCGIQPLSEDPVSVGTSAGTKVCGLSYRRASEIVERLNAMADRGVRCDILVLHLAFGELNRMGAASDLSAADVLKPLKALGVRLVLMGHIHICQETEIDGITFAYSGSTEVCSMNEPHEKSFYTVDPFTFILSRNPIATRKIVPTVIGNEKEFAAYAASVAKGDQALQAVYVAPDVLDGVRRLRALASENGLLMRVQVLQPHGDASVESPEVDRTSGVMGLEQAIGATFRPDSEEADLVRAILRAPDALKVTVDAYMKKGQP